MTPIADLRKAVTKEVTSPLSHNTYVIRRINQVDFNRAQLTPILPAADATPEAAATEVFRRTVDVTQYTLEKGARVFFGPEDSTPEGSIHADWIAGDEGFLTDEILKFSGLDTESQQKLNELLKNANGSEPLTPSGASTESSQAKS